MKHKLVKLTIAIILLGSLVVQGAPFKTWSWKDPTTYTNSLPIPAGDLITRTLKCGTTQGGPYPNVAIFVSQISPSVEDMVFVVNGVPGEYFCVSTVWSLGHMTQSGFSNERPFTVTPTGLGFVPNPPVLGPPIDS